MKKFTEKSKTIRKSLGFFDWIDEKDIKIFSYKSYLIIVDVSDVDFFLIRVCKKFYINQLLKFCIKRVQPLHVRSQRLY